MSDSKPTAVDAARRVSQALKKSLDEIKSNIKYTPQEAALRIKDELRKHIVEVREYLVDLQKREALSKPPVSEAQRRAMGAAASGHSNIGIPKSVGKEFIDKDKGGHLPEKSHKKSEPMAKEHIGFDKLKEKLSHKSGITNPAAVAAKIGQEKYGKKGMEAKAAAAKKAEGSFSMSDSNDEGSASVSISDGGKARVRVDTKKGEQSEEVMHDEASQPESLADKHTPTAYKKKGKTAAFEPGPGKMVKAIAGLEGDKITSPLVKRRTVFDILGKSNVAPAVSGRAPTPDMIVKSTGDELKERSSTVSGTVLPSDKDQKRADTEKTGSGGKIVKGPSMKGKGEKVGEGATWKATRKTEVPAVQDPQKKDDGSGGKVKPGVKKTEVPAVKDPQAKDDGSGGKVKVAKGVKKTEVPALCDPNEKDDASGGKVKPDTNVKKGETFKEAKRSMAGDINQEPMDKTTLPMSKGGGKAFLGGKDQVSQMMARDAHMAQGYTQSQNQKMPAAQQSLKMPSPKEHAGRADMYSQFMPKGFNKGELEKDMKDMDAHFSKFKKGKKK